MSCLSLPGKKAHARSCLHAFLPGPFCVQKYVLVTTFKSWFHFHNNLIQTGIISEYPTTVCGSFIKYQNTIMWCNKLIVLIGFEDNIDTCAKVCFSNSFQIVIPFPQMVEMVIVDHNDLIQTVLISEYAKAVFGSLSGPSVADSPNRVCNRWDTFFLCGTLASLN